MPDCLAYMTSDQAYYFLVCAFFGVPVLASLLSSFQETSFPIHTPGFQCSVLHLKTPSVNVLTALLAALLFLLSVSLNDSPPLLTCLSAPRCSIATHVFSWTNK
ncbi:hypothetical protein XENOCAPTIV_004926 [Xenoophorus captivus]|uniref:Uncharacterized protein n=1 Tax=Xenoophorus captivus TaxID=1517983 RepID=A0ABV0S2A8_9TELE